MTEILALVVLVLFCASMLYKKYSAERDEKVWLDAKYPRPYIDDESGGL